MFDSSSSPDKNLNQLKVLFPYLNSLGEHRAMLSNGPVLPVMVNITSVLVNALDPRSLRSNGLLQVTLKLLGSIRWHSHVFGFSVDLVSIHSLVDNVYTQLQ